VRAKRRTFAEVYCGGKVLLWRKEEGYDVWA
jgi:hypothetical protein